MANYYYFMIEGFQKPFGYAHFDFVKEMTWSRVWSVDHEKRILTLHSPNDFQQRTQLVHDTLRSGHDSGKVEALRRWNKEIFAIYDSDGQHIMDMVGSGLPLFGVIVFGVHMIAYTRTEEGRKYWVPRRSKTKMSYPGKLDNTVGGSLASGERAIDCMVRESAEEASLPEEYTRANLKACGALSYQMSLTDTGKPGCQHQVQFLYELELPQNMIPKPCDGEVEDFSSKSLAEVQEALAGGEFKWNCAMTWMAYFIRHGIVNPENEPDLEEICSRLHRKLDIFMV